MRHPPPLSDICVKYIANKLSSLDGNKDITLPDELYIKILQHLRNQGLLSSSTLASFLIPKIHSINFTSCVQINDECIETISRVCPSIQNIVLSKCPLITDHGIQVIAGACLALSLLYISKCYQITDKAFADTCILAILDNLCTIDDDGREEKKEERRKPFSNLIELDVSGTKITDDTVVHIGNCCTDLKLLDLSDCNITIKAIEIVEQKLSGLKVLRVSGCHMEYGSSFKQLRTLEGLVARQCPLIGDSTIVDLIHSSSSLSSLDLQWSGITDVTVEELQKIDTKLVSLKLSWCSLIGEAALAKLLRTCVTLQTLDVSWRSLHDETLHVISQNCTNLKSLDISGCNELSAKSLATCGADTLEFLTLSWCKGLNDEAFNEIIRKSPNLKTIDISLCTGISSMILPELGKCKKLQAVMALKCPQLTDAAFLDLFKNLPDLTIVNLSESHITDAAVIELAHNANKLRILVIAGCKAITSRALIALADNCPSLESVNASSTMVDDEGVEALVSRCGGLVSITLIGCKQITNDSVLAIAQKTRVLQHIFLSYCPLITESALLQLSQKCPYLQVVEFSNCMTVTDSVVCELVMHASLLQVLNASGCQSLTDASIDYLWLYGQHLTSVDVSRCPAITPPAIASFSALMPHVTIRKT